MSESDLLESVKGLGESRADIAQRLCASPLAPERDLSPSALGMWFTRGKVPLAWRSAALERLGRITSNDEAAA